MQGKTHQARPNKKCGKLEITGGLTCMSGRATETARTGLDTQLETLWLENRQKLLSQESLTKNLEVSISGCFCRHVSATIFESQIANQYGKASDLGGSGDQVLQFPAYVSKHH